MVGKFAAVCEEQVQENTEKILVAIAACIDVMNVMLCYFETFLECKCCVVLNRMVNVIFLQLTT